MRVALLGDIHGNISALHAVENDLLRTKPDEIWFLGDAVGKGPDSDYCFDWVRKHCSRWIAGNWDYGVGKKIFPGDGIYQRQLGDERMNYLAQLPEEYDLVFSGRKLRLIHGRPVIEELPTGTETKEELQPMFSGKNGETFDVVIYADMHRQLLRTLSCGQLYNIGSVGNATGVIGAFYALMEGERGEKPAFFEMRMCYVPYDPAQSIEHARLFFGENDFRYLSYRKELLTGEYVRRAPNTPLKKF